MRSTTSVNSYREQKKMPEAASAFTAVIQSYPNGDMAPRRTTASGRRSGRLDRPKRRAPRGRR